MKNFVLVVDDNLVNLNYISGQLEALYRVVIAKSGEQALKICKREPPDLILLDVEMPGMDGFETIAEFQKTPTLSSVPVIFLTANHDTETEIKGLECGAADFITKPFNKSILLHRIAHHLKFSQYQRSLEHTVKELEDNIVNGFSEIVEYRDTNTGGHIVRTSRYVDLLGKGLRKQSPRFADELSPAELDIMVRAAPLHDIGKIAIRDAILLKPGKLTPEEFEIMKTHAAIGGKLLRQMYERMPTQRYLKYGIMIAEGHHEKFDGSGYPDGVAGENIPLCARLMAVADVYDALIDDRCYRSGMTHEAACEIIVNGKGSHFDPLLIDVFVEIQDQFQSVAKSLK